jgi:hypothetical protein
MIDDIDKIINEFKKLGCSHKQALNIIECATTLSDEELERIAELNKILEEQKCIVLLQKNRFT